MCVCEGTSNSFLYHLHFCYGNTSVGSSLGPWELANSLSYSASQLESPCLQLTGSTPSCSRSSLPDVLPVHSWCWTWSTSMVMYKFSFTMEGFLIFPFYISSSLSMMLPSMVLVTFSQPHGKFFPEVNSSQILSSVVKVKHHSALFQINALSSVSTLYVVSTP